MNHQSIPSPSTCSFGTECEAYAGVLLREAVRLLARRRPVTEVDDIASMLVVAFLAKAATIMAQHPDPASYARVAVKRTGIGYTVSEVAELVGQRRETLSRRLGRIRRQVEANRAMLQLSAAG